MPRATANSSSTIRIVAAIWRCYSGVCRAALRRLVRLRHRRSVDLGQVTLDRAVSAAPTLHARPEGAERQPRGNSRLAPGVPGELRTTDVEHDIPEFGIVRVRTRLRIGDDGEQLAGVRSRARKRFHAGRVPGAGQSPTRSWSVLAPDGPNRTATTAIATIAAPRMTTQWRSLRGGVARRPRAVLLRWRVMNPISSNYGSSLLSLADCSLPNGGMPA